MLLCSEELEMIRLMLKLIEAGCDENAFHRYAQRKGEPILSP